MSRGEMVTAYEKTSRRCAKMREIIAEANLQKVDLDVSHDLFVQIGN